MEAPRNLQERPNLQTVKEVCERLLYSRATLQAVMMTTKGMKESLEQGNKWLETHGTNS